MKTISRIIVKYNSWKRWNYVLTKTGDQLWKIICGPLYHPYCLDPEPEKPIIAISPPLRQRWHLKPTGYFHKWFSETSKGHLIIKTQCYDLNMKSLPWVLMSQTLFLEVLEPQAGSVIKDVLSSGIYCLDLSCCSLFPVHHEVSSFCQMFLMPQFQLHTGPEERESRSKPRSLWNWTF